MKAFELFGLYESFDRLMASNDFDKTSKTQLGREMLASLPPEPFCAATPHTNQAIRASMLSRIAALENELNAALKAAKPQEGQEATEAAPETPAPAAKGRNRKV